MGFLARVAMLALVVTAGCYDPDLPDCTLTCNGNDSCGPGQVCGNDGYCAAPAVAGTCGPAVEMAQLVIRVDRKGRVTLDNPAFACESTGGMQTCTTMVPKTGWTDLHAVRTDKEFERWTSLRCAGQGETCHLLLGDPMIEVAAKFR